MSTQKNGKLLDDMRQVMRVNHYSIHTERSYLDWIKRFILFHEMKSRKDFVQGEEKITDFLTHLAIDKNVAPATQNQAMNALVFLYKKVLKVQLDKEINAVRSVKKNKVPTVLSREEVGDMLAVMEGVPQLVAKIIYGSGLRIMESVRLRVHDIDFEYK